MPGQTVTDLGYIINDHLTAVLRESYPDMQDDDFDEMVDNATHGACDAVDDFLLEVEMREADRKIIRKVSQNDDDPR